MNDCSNVIKARKGNSNAFVELMNACQGYLYKIAFAYMKNEQDALEVVSETVFKAYINIDKLKNPEYFNTWIIKILINLCINKLRVNNHIILIEEYEEIHSNGNGLSNIDLEIPRNVDLYNAIDKLDLRSKSIIILKYFEDMTIMQISEILDTPQGTVKSNIHRTLKKLKNELEEECI